MRRGEAPGPDAGLGYAVEVSSPPLRETAPPLRETALPLRETGGARLVASTRGGGSRAGPGGGSGGAGGASGKSNGWGNGRAAGESIKFGKAGGPALSGYLARPNFSAASGAGRHGIVLSHGFPEAGQR